MDAPVVIVGSGPSGAMAARVLYRRGVPTVLLESGSRFPGGQLVKAFGATIWRRHARKNEEPQFTASGDATTTWFADYAPGGLSNQWTGAVPRFSPEDFGDGARLGPEYEWPIAYGDVARYYSWAERALQIAGAGTDFPAVPAGEVVRRVKLPKDWQELSTKSAARGDGIMPVPLAAGPSWGAYRRSTPFNSYVRLLRPIIRRDAAFVRLGAHVTRLNWDPRLDRVSSVEYVDRVTKREGRVEASAVILAAGAVNSARILLSSTSNMFPDGIGNHAGLVGSYLHDHPHHMFALELGRPLTRLGHTAYLTRLPYDGSEPLTAAQCTMGGRMTLADRALAALPLKATTLGVIVFGTMRPERRNRVALNADVCDAFGEPVPDIRISFSQRDIRTAHDAESRLVSLFEDLGLSPRLQWRLNHIVPGTAVHYAGTARMHASAEYGVVDGFSRLHDCPNVLVADTSVFTTCVEKNPTLTSMALAARAADALSDRLRESHG